MSMTRRVFCFGILACGASTVLARHSFRRTEAQQVDTEQVLRLRNGSTITFKGNGDDRLESSLDTFSLDDIANYLYEARHTPPWQSDYYTIPCNVRSLMLG